MSVCVCVCVCVCEREREIVCVCVCALSACVYDFSVRKNCVRIAINDANNNGQKLYLVANLIRQ